MAGCSPRASAVLSGLLGLVAVAAGDDRAASAGRWQITHVEVNGKRVDPEFTDMLAVDYAADGSWVVLLKTVPVGEGASEVDETKTPKAFQMETRGAGGRPGRRYVGIYDTTENTRRLCFVSADRPRPREFRSTANGGEILVELEKAMPTRGLRRKES